MKLEFSQHIFEKSQISNFIKTHPGGAELFHAHRQAGMAKLIVAFHNFTNTHKNHLLNFCLQSTKVSDDDDDDFLGGGGWGGKSLVDLCLFVS
jgi:hypothetical protein